MSAARFAVLLGRRKVQAQSALNAFLANRSLSGAQPAVGGYGALRMFSSLPSHVIIGMPALSPTMSQGNIIKWHVKVGDEVKPGVVLADIETDKATLAFENQEEGFIAQILVSEGSKDIPIGRPVAVLVDDKGDIPAFANFSAGGKPAAAAAASSAPAPPAPPEAPGKQYPAHQTLTMPALSPTMDRGNIVAWKAKVGDELRPGDILAEIETDKATLGFENQEDGFLAKILAPDGSKDIKIGTPVAIIVEDKALISAFADYTSAPAAPAAAPAPASSKPAAPAAAAAAPKAPAAAPGAAPGANASSRMGPAARLLLEEAGLTRFDVAPTGPNNIITKGDVLAAIAAGVKHVGAPATAVALEPVPPPPAAKPKPAAAAAPAPAAAAPRPVAPAAAGSRGHTDTPNTQIRKIIAQRLLESKVTIPGLYVSVDARLDALAALRQSLQTQGVKVSVNDFVLKAVAAALRDVPAANVFWDEKAPEGGAVKGFSSVDISVAVATERGLITPIVKNADTKSLQQISKDVKSLALKARENKLKPEEFIGGSFTVSNLGMYGVSSFLAIINPPQAGILAVGGTQQRVVLGKDGAPAAESFMTLSLSADHRVYDGALASAFMKALSGHLENPVNLLM